MVHRLPANNSKKCLDAYGDLSLESANFSVDIDVDASGPFESFNLTCFSM